MSARPSRGQRLGWLQFAAVVRKEVLQTVRDPSMLFMLIAAPLIQGVLFGFAVDFDVDRVPTAIADFDGGSQSREQLRHLLADGTLRRAAAVRSVGEAKELIDRGGTAAAVVIPPRFGSDLLAGRPAEVRVVLGTDPNRAGVAASAVSRYFDEAGAELARERGGRVDEKAPGSVTVTPQMFYNPRLQSAPYVIPGILAMLLVVVTTIVSAMGLSREREVGTLEQVLVTPIRPLPLLAGKMTPFVFIGLLDVLLLLAMGCWIFDVPLRGPLLVLFAGTLLYLLSTLGVGLLISTLSRTQQQAFVGGFLFVLPAVMLSGVITPIRSMPAWLRAATWVNPLRHFQELARANVLKGAGFRDVWPQLALMAIFGTAIFTIAALRFRKQLR